MLVLTKLYCNAVAMAHRVQTQESDAPGFESLLCPVTSACSWAGCLIRLRQKCITCEMETTNLYLMRYLERLIRLVQPGHNKLVENKY